MHFVPCDRSPTKILLRDARSSPRRRLYWETGTVVLPHDPCGLRLSFPRRATRRALTPGSPCFCCFFIHLLQLLQACSLFINWWRDNHITTSNSTMTSENLLPSIDQPDQPVSLNQSRSGGKGGKMRQNVNIVWSERVLANQGWFWRLHRVSIY